MRVEGIVRIQIVEMVKEITTYDLFLR